MIQEKDLNTFKDLLVTRTGIAVPPEDIGKLAPLLKQFARDQTGGNLQEYLRLLESQSGSHRAWAQIAEAVTIGESYFLRDRGQIALLEKQILPKLIEDKRNSRKLRVISAGCSTGEEPYSIAMLLHTLIPDYPSWQIDIVGLDLNPDVIRKARTGTYREWSFRGQGKDVQSRYFEQEEDSWKIIDTIRTSVRFLEHNLLQDELPNSPQELKDADLIICRNVFIYFSQEAIASVLKKFLATLREDGYLLTGHVELTGQDLSALEALHMPDSLVYRKRKAVQESPIKNKFFLPQTMPSKVSAVELKRQHETVPGPAEAIRETQTLNALPVEELASKPIELFHRGEYRRVIEQLSKEDASCLSNDNFKLLVEACINAGMPEDAQTHCTRFIEFDDLNPLPYYLLAHLAQEQGETKQAKELLRRVIYLNSQAVGAYLSLGIIYESEGNSGRAQKERQAALQVLQQLDAKELVPFLENVRVAELTGYIETLIERGA